jgi:hypothetical protein
MYHDVNNNNNKKMVLWTSQPVLALRRHAADACA